MVDKVAFTTMLFFLTLLSIVIYAENSHKDLALELIPIDTIDSHMFPKNLSLKERHQKLIEISDARAFHYRSSYPNFSLPIIQPSICPILGGGYVTKVLIGAGVQFYRSYLVVDTGSDLAWVQGEGCTKCFEIQTGNYHYSASWKFHRLPCEHHLCVPKICDANGFCLYELRYGFSSTKGFIGTDEFAFIDSALSHQTFNLTFGVGLENEGNLFGPNMGPNNTIGGVLGLGKGPRSMLLQLDTFTRGRISYCLKPWNAQDRTSALNFGDHAQIRNTSLGRVQATPIIRDLPRYFLYLLGISIDGNLLTIDPSVFQVRQGRVSGFVIDSGTGITRLTESAYKVFKRAMILHFQGYGMSPNQGVHRSFDVCYKKPYPRNLSYPRMGYHFQGAELFIDPRATFVQFDDGFCLAIKPIPDYGPSILGSYQQTNHRFLYDIKSLMLYFVPEIC